MASLRGEVQGHVLWVSRPGALPKVCIDCSELGEHTCDITLRDPRVSTFEDKIAFRVWRCATCHSKNEMRRRLTFVVAAVLIVAFIGWRVLTRLPAFDPVLSLFVFVLVLIGGGVLGVKLRPRELLLKPAYERPDAIGGLIGIDPRAIEKIAKVLSERERKADENRRREEAGLAGYRLNERT